MAVKRTWSNNAKKMLVVYKAAKGCGAGCAKFRDKILESACALRKGTLELSAEKAYSLMQENFASVIADKDAEVQQMIAKEKIIPDFASWLEAKGYKSWREVDENVKTPEKETFSIWRSTDRPNRLGKCEQLCWRCQRVDRIEYCQFVWDHKIIQGMDYEVVRQPSHSVADKQYLGDFYKVYDCPRFVEIKNPILTGYDVPASKNEEVTASAALAKRIKDAEVTQILLVETAGVGFGTIQAIMEGRHVKDSTMQRVEAALDKLIAIRQKEKEGNEDD